MGQEEQTTQTVCRGGQLVRHLDDHVCTCTHFFYSVVVSSSSQYVVVVLDIVLN